MEKSSNYKHTGVKKRVVGLQNEIVSSSTNKPTKHKGRLGMAIICFNADNQEKPLTLETYD